MSRPPPDGPRSTARSTSSTSTTSGGHAGELGARALRRRAHDDERLHGDGPDAVVRHLRAGGRAAPMTERVSSRSRPGRRRPAGAGREAERARRRMFQAIIEAGERCAADPSVRVAVLSGDGKAFCAGLDTSLFAAMAEKVASRRRLRSPAHPCRGGPRVRVWTDLAAPVIAAVHGVAVGGGFQLALGADIRVVAPDTQLGVFEIKWGIVPDMCGTQLLPPTRRPRRRQGPHVHCACRHRREAKALGLATRLSDDPRPTRSRSRPRSRVATPTRSRS